jgi:hypothetical protein
MITILGLCGGGWLKTQIPNEILYFAGARKIGKTLFSLIFFFNQKI